MDDIFKARPARGEVEDVDDDDLDAEEREKDEPDPEGSPWVASCAMCTGRDHYATTMQEWKAANQLLKSSEVLDNQRVRMDAEIPMNHGMTSLH